MAARRLDYTVRQIIKKHHSHSKLFKELQIKEFLNLLVFANMRGSLLADRRRSVTDCLLAVGNR